METATERPDVALQPVPPNHFQQLLQRIDGPQELPEVNGADLEQVAVSGQHDALFSAGTKSDIGNGRLGNRSGIDADHAQISGQFSHVDIDQEPQYGEGLRPQYRWLIYESLVGKRVDVDPLSTGRDRLKGKLPATTDDSTYFGMRNACSLDDILDGRTTVKGI